MILPALAGVRCLAIDTAPLVYLIEEHATFRALVEQVLVEAALASVRLVTASLTLTEVLVHPLRRGRFDLVDRYRAILLGDPALRIIDFDAAAALLAAQLRARYNLRTPDAIQIASVLVGGADAFLTNDRDLSRVTELRVILLSDLVPPSS